MYELTSNDGGPLARTKTRHECDTHRAMKLHDMQRMWWWTASASEALFGRRDVSNIELVVGK